MTLLTSSQRDDLRRALLTELVNARRCAFSAEVLVRRVKRSGMIDFEFSLQEAEAELSALVTAGLADPVKDKIATALHYQVTPAGLAEIPV